MPVFINQEPSRFDAREEFFIRIKSNGRAECWPPPDDIEDCSKIYGTDHSGKRQSCQGIALDGTANPPALSHCAICGMYPGNEAE